MAEKVKIQYEAEIRDVLDKLKTLEGANASMARQITSDLATAVRAQEKAAAAAAKVGQAHKLTEQQISRNKEALASLGAALNVVDPALGQMVMQAGAATGALKAGASVAGTFGVSLGAVAGAAAAVAIPIAALVVLYKDIEREMRLENELAETQRKALESLTPVTRALEQSRIDLAVATGDMSEEEAKYLRVQLASQRAVLDFAKAQEEMRSELRKTEDKAATMAAVVHSSKEILQWTPVGLVGRVTGANDALEDGINSLAGWGDEAENAKARAAALDRALERMAATQTELRNNLLDAEAAKGGGKGRGGAGKNTEADTQREVADATREAEKATEALARARQDAVLSALGPMDALLAKQEFEIENYRRLAVTAGATQDDLAALAEIEMQQAREVAALKERLDAEEKARQDEKAAQLERYYDKARSVAIGSLGDAASAAQTMAEVVGKNNAALGERYFGFYKGLAATEVVVSGTLAAMEAFKALAGIPYVGPILGAAAFATTEALAIAQAAKITSQPAPTYYAGTPMSSQDSYSATLHRGEAVVPRADVRAAGGPEAVRDRVRGGGLTVLEMRIDGRVLGAASARQVRRGGPLADEITRHTGRLGRA